MLGLVPFKACGVIALCMVAGVTSACAAGGTGSATDGGLTISTGSWEPGDDAMEMAIEGTIKASSNGCIYLAGKRGGGADIVWPSGYRLHVESDEDLTILNQDGEVIARAGEPFSAGGGEAGDQPTACRADGLSGAIIQVTDDLP